LKFEFPKEIMDNPNPSELVNYEFLGGFIPPGTDDDGHCMTCIKNEDGFWEFNGDAKQPITDAVVRDSIKLKFKPGAWRKTNSKVWLALKPGVSLAYKRKRQLPDYVSAYENAMRFLNAIPAFKDGIMSSKSKNPLVLGLQEIFGSINSTDGIEKEPLKKLLEERIFPKLNEDRAKNLA
jgi:hypothetical protein